MNEKIDDCVPMDSWVFHKNDYKRKVLTIEDLVKRVTCLERRCKAIDDTLLLKLDITEMDTIKTMVQQLPDIAEVERIKNFV